MTALGGREADPAAPHSASRPLAFNPARVLKWSFFLSASWTWCIGMFLPALLMRDYGPWAFLVFAVPNVVGAAAMGVLLRSPADSRAITDSHGSAWRAFSLVTIAFHAAFWVGVVHPAASLGGVFGPATLLMLLALGASVAGWGAAASIAAILTSAALGLVFLTRGGPAALPQADAVRAAVDASTLPLLELAALAPVCLFGFALCPYLDRTFHRARQDLESPSESRLAFATGFGVLFLAMIALTAVYAPLFWQRWSGSPLGVRPPREVVAPIALHLAMQLGVTVGLHLRELWVDASTIRPPEASGEPRRRRSPARWSWFGLAALSMIFSVAIAAMPRAGTPPPPALGPPDNDPVAWYRVFMGAYGLAFPAYVWLCVLPLRRKTSRPHRPPRARALATLAASAAIASPLFYMGFVERQAIYLLPGLGIVLLARVALRRPPPGAGPGYGENPSSAADPGTRAESVESFTDAPEPGAPGRGAVDPAAAGP